MIEEESRIEVVREIDDEGEAALADDALGSLARLFLVLVQAALALSRLRKYSFTGQGPGPSAVRRHELQPFGLELLVLLVGPLVEGEEEGVAVAVEGQGHFGDVPVVEAQGLDALGSGPAPQALLVLEDPVAEILGLAEILFGGHGLEYSLGSGLPREHLDRKQGIARGEVLALDDDPSGTLSLMFVKFQIEVMPARTRVSAVAWAKGEGTVRMAISALIVLMPCSMLSSARTGTPWTWRAHLLGVGVEGGDYAQAVALELLVAHQGRTQVARSDEDGVVVLVPAEIALDRLDELLDRIALLGLADDAGDREVLADLDGLEVELLGDDGAGNIEIVVPLGLADDMEIRRQAPDRRRVRDLYFRFAMDTPLKSTIS